MPFTSFQIFKACESGSHDDCTHKNATTAWLFICSCPCHKLKGDSPAGDKPEIDPALQPTKWVYCGICEGQFEVHQDVSDDGDGWCCSNCVIGELEL